MKKYLVALLLGSIILCLCAFANAEVVGGDAFGGAWGGGSADIFWSLDLSTGEMTITGTGAWNDYSDDYYVPYKQYLQSIKKVSIGEGITSIAAYAFDSCKNLNSVSIPSTVTSIGRYAFGYCSTLLNVQLPGQLEIIGDEAFVNCSALTKVNIPQSVIKIGTEAFRRTIAMKGSLVTYGSIGESAFSGCGVASIEVKNCSQIGAYAFQDCENLTQITLCEGITSIPKKAFAGSSILNKINIPSSVISIGEYAFDECIALKTVEIPDSVKNIMRGAFRKSGLTSIVLPNSVAVMENSVFEGCRDLVSANIPREVGTVPQYTFENCSSLINIDIADGIGQIGSSAFYQCSALPKITLPDSVSMIDDHAFCGCKNLTSIELPVAIHTIGEGAFSGCSKLLSITLPEGITSISASTFYTAGLISIGIPASMKNIQSGAFAYCSQLKNVYYAGNDSKNISIADRNGYFINAIWHYNESLYTGPLSELWAIHYEWSEDNSQVTASAVCGNNANHIISETVDTSSRVTTKETCETEGSITYTSDYFESDLFERQTKTASISATGHSWGTVNYTWDYGYKTVTASRTCDNNRNHNEKETVNVTSKVSQEATCEDYGYTTYTSEKFKNTAFEVQTRTEKNIQPKGHSLTKHDRVEPTATKDGIEAYWECPACGKLFSDQYGKNEILKPVTIPATGEHVHTLIKHAQVEATCTSDGYEAYWECSECGKLFSDSKGKNEINEPVVIRAKGHSLKKHNMVEATCTSDGYEAYWECSECGKLFSDSKGKNEINEPVVIRAKGHSLKKHNKVEATCTSDGYEAYWECGECGKLFSDSKGKNEINEPVVIRAKGHSLKKHNKVEATETTEGTEAYWECTGCGKLFSDAKGKNEIEEPVVIPMKDKVAQFVNRSYIVILTRKPDTGGMNTWLNELNSGRKTASEIIDRFVNSPEFVGKNYSNEEAVDILYQTMLGRNADPAGKTNWVKKLESGQTLANVINGFCFSNEFRGLCDSYGIKAGFVNIPNTDTTAEGKIKAFVQRCYRIILDREADPSGMQTWYEQLSSGKKEAAEIIDRFVNSPEFSGKNYSHSDSVEILYKAMLGRGSDAAGKANWVNKLDAGQPFAVVINGFCVSKEFTGICESYGIKPGSVTVQPLSGMADEEALSMLALNAKAPITRRSETKPNRVEIINPSDTIDMNIGTAVQAVYINDEKAKEFISRCYRVILGREASEAELTNWIGQMVNGTKSPDQIARGFLFSNEFKAKSLGNEELVKILYRVYMNRDADPEGLKTWMEKLDGGTSLKDLLDTFSKTNEFKKVISEMSK